MATTHHDDIALVIGDEWVILGHLLDESGQPIDLNNANINLGWTLLGSDGNHVPGVADAATLEKQSGGDVLITVPDTFTRTLLPGRFMDSIRVWIDDAPATQWTGIILADADTFHPTVLITPPVPEEPPVPTIEDAPQDGKLYARQDGQWVPIPSGFSMRFEYQFDDKLVAPPLNSQLRLDNVNGALATKVWVHNNNADGLDVSNMLALIAPNYIIFVQDKDEPSLFQRYRALAPAANLGTYCELSVAIVESGGALKNNQRCFIMIYGGG
jgi:hypothetical protein